MPRPRLFMGGFDQQEELRGTIFVMERAFDLLRMVMAAVRKGEEKRREEKRSRFGQGSGNSRKYLAIERWFSVAVAA